MFCAPEARDVEAPHDSELTAMPALITAVREMKLRRLIVPADVDNAADEASNFSTFMIISRGKMALSGSAELRLTVANKKRELFRPVL